MPKCSKDKKSILGFSSPLMKNARGMHSRFNKFLFEILAFFSLLTVNEIAT